MQGLNEALLQQLAPEGLQTVQEIEALVTEVSAFLACLSVPAPALTPQMPCIEVLPHSPVHKILMQSVP